MIVKMSKYDFVLYSGQSEDFIERLRRTGLVDITVSGWEPSEEDRDLLTEIEARTKAADALRTFAAGDDYKAGAAAVPDDDVYAVYRDCSQRIAAMNGDIARLRKTADEYRPWGEFSAEKLNRLAAGGVVLRYFTAPASAYEEHAAEWGAAYDILPVAESAGMVYFVAVTREGAEVVIDAAEMKAPRMDFRTAEAQAEALQKDIEALYPTLSACADKVGVIERECAALKERLQRVKITATAESAAEGRLTVMEGWAEKETSAQVDALLEEYPNVVYIKSDPTPEDNTPVKLKNNRFARIFELVGDMYARPKYGTLDLTPFFAPFYMLFFGICLNDAGYGLVLLAAGLFMLWKFKDGFMRRAAWFATMCAISTVLFGLLCGSFFGINLAQTFPAVPFLDFQGQFFSIALAIGVVQIMLGLLLRVITLSSTFGFRYSLSTLGWLLVILALVLSMGLPAMNANWSIAFYTTSSPAFYATIGLGMFLLLFFNSPGKNPLVNFGSGLWELYNNVTGILSDVLSYIRLFAIGLSGGILATVFNNLAEGMSPDIPGLKIVVMIVILLIGHGINLFMSVISSFVHPMRLTFVEFYKNAGFEMASRNFEPLQKLEK